MVTTVYIPERGDAVWMSFTPQAGHEQAGRRPAVVLSPKSYNQKVGLAIFCPITNQIKGYPFEVILPPEIGVTGVILSDQVKSLDWTARQARRKGSVAPGELDEVRAKILALVGKKS